MNYTYTLRPFTNEMWAALEEEQSLSSSGPTYLAQSLQETEAEAENDTENEPKAQKPPPQALSSRSPRLTGSESPAVPSRPITTPNLHPEIDPQHLGVLQTLANVATSSRSALSRLTGQVSERNMDETEREGEEEEEEEELEEEGHGSSVSLISPHHTRSPRSSDIHRAQQGAISQSETRNQHKVIPQATRQKRQREVEAFESPPARNLRRRPSPPVASSSRQTLSLRISHSQSQSQSISGPSTSTLPPDHQDEIVVSQTRGYRRPVLDISSEQLLSSIRDQLRESQFQRYTMPHPKRDGTVSGKKWRCAYELETGNRCNIACSRKGEARRHAFTHEIHLRWICPSLADDASSCGKLFARQDAATRHLEQSKSCKDLASAGNRSEGFPILIWEEEDETVANIVTLAWTEDDNNEGNE